MRTSVVAPNPPDGSETWLFSDAAYKETGKAES